MPNVIRVLIPLCFVALVLASAPAAQGAKQDCVTAGEFSRLSNGMTMSRVHKVFGTSGKLLFRNPGTVSNTARTYRSCKALQAKQGATVQVQFTNYR